MIFLRFITVANRTESVGTTRLNWVSLLVGSLATVLLSFVANFPEDQRHGVGHTHQVGAGVVFTAGWVFIVVDTAITHLTRREENRRPRWFEWIRPVVAVLSFFAWLLCILCYSSLYIIQLNEHLSHQSYVDSARSV